MKLRLKTMECHLLYVISHFYLLPDTSEQPCCNPSQTGRNSIDLPWKDGRLS